MTTHRDQKALADDPAAVRRLARFLLDLPDHAWTDWELNFLDSMLARGDEGPLTTRQAEVLTGLRDDAVLYRRHDGFSVALLVRSCFEDRLELEKDDLAFIERLHGVRADAVRRRELYRLLRIAREVGVIEPLAA